MNIEDLRKLAQRRLPPSIYPFLEGAAEDEVTARRNVDAFEQLQIIPDALVDVAEVKTSVRLLGQELEWPVFCSSSGASRLFHPDGELAVARGAARMGTLYGLSSNSTYDLESVAEASAGPKLFQILIFKDREITRELIKRCKQAGYKALVLTVDVPVRGNCERERRAGLTGKISLRQLLGFATHPRYSFGQLRRGPMVVPLIAELTGVHKFLANSQYLGTQLDPTVSWRDVREFIDLWNGPFAIKGIMSAGDAMRVAEVGASSVIVSNHGGRQLDGAVSSIEALPAVVKAVGEHLEVILDGGVRRGVHILKALALGAKACSIGRAYLFGLAAEGENGVSKALEILRSELVRAMQLSGCTDVTQVSRNLIQPASPWS